MAELETFLERYRAFVWKADLTTQTDKAARLKLLKGTQKVLGPPQGEPTRSDSQEMDRAVPLKEILMGATGLSFSASEKLRQAQVPAGIKRRISPARASWLYIGQVDSLDEKQKQSIELIRVGHPDLDRAYQLTQQFVCMLAEHRDTDLDQWLAQAERCGIRELESFAHGIQRDYDAVRACFTSQWSNWPVEAQVNCLKLQKRLMFGRANFDLLRLRVLRRA